MSNIYTCICPVVHQSCPAPILLLMNASCPAYPLSCISPVLHQSCPAPILLLMNSSCPAHTLACIHPVLHLSTANSFFASLILNVVRLPALGDCQIINAKQFLVAKQFDAKFFGGEVKPEYPVFFSQNRWA